MPNLFYAGPKLDVLHEEYAKKHRIDDQAGIKAVKETTIAAPVERVWQLLSDVANWDETLEPGVRDIQLANGVTVDGRFTRKKSGATMKAQFAVVEPLRELAWTGKAFGAKAVHRFVLEPVGDNETRVVTEESMAGPLFGLIFNTAKLEAVLDEALVTLKRAAEATPA